jgi:hypothetical protein
MTSSPKMIVPVEAVGKDNQGNFVFVLNQKSEGCLWQRRKSSPLGNYYQKDLNSSVV